MLQQHKLYNNFTDESTTADKAKLYDKISKSYDKDVNIFYNGWTDSTVCVNVLDSINLDTTIDDKHQLQILDLACGTGLTGQELYKRGYTTIDGLDISQGMIEQANKKQVYRNLYNSTLEEFPTLLNDINTNQSIKRYDVITCTGGIGVGHIEAAMLYELPKFVKPKGHIIFGLRDDHLDHGYAAVIDNMTYGNITVWQEVKKEKFMKYPNCCDPENYIKETMASICCYQHIF
jgi:2-polyprenyl-3-methyl-5-hydroxy-6-metoxy-1,4-benzoquinol methylase